MDEVREGVERDRIVAFLRAWSVDQKYLCDKGRGGDSASALLRARSEALADAARAVAAQEHWDDNTKFLDRDGNYAPISLDA